MASFPCLHPCQVWTLVVSVEGVSRYRGCCEGMGLWWEGWGGSRGGGNPSPLRGLSASPGNRGRMKRQAPAGRLLGSKDEAGAVLVDGSESENCLPDASLEWPMGSQIVSLDICSWQKGMGAGKKAGSTTRFGGTLRKWGWGGRPCSVVCYRAGKGLGGLW